MKRLIKRWRAKTPKFFKNVIYICGGVAFMCTTALTVNSTLDRKISDKVLDVITYVLVSSASIASISKFAKENKDENR